MKAFKRLALFSTMATYFLIFLGGLVRVSGAGLGCPDWPKCFGSWIPPLSLQQLPPDIDPSAFNITLAWIEYFNRLVGVSVGILIAIVALWALIKFTRYPRIVVPAVLAAILTAFQGWQGGVVVSSELEPLIVSTHLVIAFIIVSLMIYVTQQAYYREEPEAEAGSNYPKSSWAALVILWVITLVQVVLGTQLRESIEHLIREFPLKTDAELIQAVGAIKYVHPIFGLALAIALIYYAIKLLKAANKPSPLIWQASWTIFGLSAIQLLLGIFLIGIGLTQVVQVLHLWVASLMVGVILISIAALGQSRRVQDE